MVQPCRLIFAPSGEYKVKRNISPGERHDENAILEIDLEERWFREELEPYVLASMYDKRYCRCLHCFYGSPSFDGKGTNDLFCCAKGKTPVEDADAIRCNKYRVDYFYNELKEGVDYIVWRNPRFVS